MINRVVLVGRITRDPEVRKTQTGKSVTNFSLAINRRFGNQEQADFVNCVAWEQSAEFLGNFIRKGALLGVEGRIQSNSYQNNEGQMVYTQEVVCERVHALEPRSQRQQGQGYDTGYQSDVPPTFAEPQTPKFEEAEEEPILDITNDDLPF